METVTEPEAKKPPPRLRAVPAHVAADPSALIDATTLCTLDSVSLSTEERWIADGTQVPWIRLGPRCRRANSGETRATRRARIAGATDDELRELVASLVEARRRAA
jgi:hypothetical protein